MASPGFPTNIGSGTSSGHSGHHNTAHGMLNKLDANLGTASVGNVLVWDGTIYGPVDYGQRYTVYYTGSVWPALSTVPAWYISTGKSIIWNSETYLAAATPAEARDGDYWDRRVT